MSPRLRVILFVALAAAVAAGVTVGGTLLQRDDGTTAEPAPAPPRPRAGAPPLLLDLGVRLDAEARRLRRASALYARGQRATAGRLFRRSRSLPAQIGATMSAWPAGTLAELQRLKRLHSGTALVRLHLGLALFWLRRDEEAVAEFRSAERVEPDSPSAVRAETLLHPEFAPGVPVFLPSFRAPAAVTRLRIDRQFAALAARARRGGFREKLLYGVALQRLGHSLSAERVYAEAAARAPGKAEAQVAAAVGRFDKDRPARAFSRLGPLVRRFPRSQSVRFHLGLLLLWIGQVEQGKRQLELARARAPGSRLGREAARFLRRLTE